jgi:15-cis-phytoene synthase
VSDTPNIEAPDAADVAALAAVAREGEPDRYLAALLAPRAQRDDLLALAAFSAEIRRIPLLAHEPAMGEIRRQWWRDALTLPPELRSGHPVTDALRATALRCNLPAELLAGFIDSASGPFPDDVQVGPEELEARLSKAEGGLFELAARVLGVPSSAEAAAGCAAAGHAYGLARLLLELPRGLATGRVALAGTPLASAGSTFEELRSEGGSSRIKALLGEQVVQVRHSLAIAQQFVAGLSRAARVGFLPLALVEPYLRVLERSGPRFLQQEVSVAPLTRVCRIAVAHLFGL